MNTKKIFSKRLAIYLRQQGFKIEKTEPNFHKPEWDVYTFKSNDELDKAISDYINNKIASNS